MDVRCVANLKQLCDDIYSGIDFMMIDICNAVNFRDQKTIHSRDIALTRPGKFSNSLKDLPPNAPILHMLSL